MAKPSAAALVAAFLAVYIIWGSTYFAISIGIQTMPPFLMAGARWLVAGVALYLWRRAAGDARPTWRQWRGAGIVGALLIVGGNGLVSFAETAVESHLAALIIAIVPLFIAAITWAQTGARPAGRVMVGILVGLLGVAVLVAPGFLGTGASAGAPWGIGIVVLASFLWSCGSMYSRKADLPGSPLLGASMEMLVGGALLSVLGLVVGEAPRVDVGAITWQGWAAFAFLVVFGSVVAYSAYVWLLKATRPELVATYAFVNPVVAVLLGVVLAGEVASPTIVPAAVLIVAAVAIVVTAPTKRGAAIVAPAE